MSQGEYVIVSLEFQTVDGSISSLQQKASKALGPSQFGVS
ncbi:unnamed protein product, partial [Arabidopsis halleri]